ncbi:Arginine--tRNA ligase [Thioalkalivibrio sulfidiphilus HL-EbGr7]|uniref:Arginine--tRNA ligase n=1 Tax=Thioalkalivibrio sulfidiphilus (strain HL-EbGR7) TaxID=396588 RepID=SYR_THISH|nr:arginine--tRNA ligase [Thioalkalivibrio sulfidiphilus]B8GU79.1 RecName: Full=Arginine--tRNA ligase; AltName: Full=Arginyl-tRNA synthetase; Short=ArgRS [Thioalkalivibrio sulfidiphilus HL-EbGr7]ACL71362.1 Arginine--tRNA ligase [Thioalkalivibrio sulfidiphilus HL-EbGr7]
MKDQLQALIEQAIDALRQDGTLPGDTAVDVQVTRTKDKAHGDFATNVALQLAKPARKKPRDVAEAIVARLPASGLVARTEIAGPGFINLFLGEQAKLSVIATIREQGERYGRSQLGAGKKVQVEFVSANPTGPLHVGHGRGAAYGAAVADLLEAVGFDVHREYYVNDAGRQMDILGTSVWLRYLELTGVELPFPTNAYRGDYVYDIAATLHREHGDHYKREAAEILDGLPPDEPDGGDKEEYIDAMIARAKELLGDNHYRFVFELGLNVILDDIRDDLAEFGVTYDTWYSERSLTDKGAVNLAIERLREAGHLYEKDGALWFRSTDFGDEKDRVVQRDNGQTTYFASDIAYHMDKMERGYDRVIDVWGADHHGYVPRVKAALKALGEDETRLDVLLVQFAILYRGGERVQMSTRSGSFVTLRELREEVGKDAARFFYVMRRCEQHLDFDLDLAKSQSADNPVYYIQYAHARVCSVLRQMEAKGLKHDPSHGEAKLSLLTESHEQEILATLARFPEVIEAAALVEEPHQIANYLRELANDFHTYYNAHQFLVDEPAIRDARLSLILAVRQVIANGLGLLGVSAPQEM